MNRNVSSVAVGFLLGVSSLLTIVSLQTAIFWGQLANCGETIQVQGSTVNVLIGDSIPHYTCDNKAGMRSVSAFASINFVLALFFTANMVRNVDGIVNELGGFDEIGPDSLHARSPYSMPTSYEESVIPKTATTADL